MTRRVIVAGSRDITDSTVVHQAIRANHPSDSQPARWDVEIVHGGAEGVDSSAEEFAEMYGLSSRVYEPDWDEHGKAAGPIRNSHMADYGDMLIAVWDGVSRGTRDMIEKALEEPMPLHVKIA